ncbi:GNAT family N-acetyltransferase [Dellaglioa algida]|uniref:GNAT family N-acetyltransferase n=1 Tax=Dellaglioa algida TaxID=105612 RepID=UPI0024C4961A|nr:GNAT family N-acetyltransferase [Dellaglioa algida]MDK1724848.1 GNAT family N-acetyltransferase [Dellaglioa algida]MDK1738612.1 GNAT family N-acetyltransferase [Dellaglioa algida]
MSIEDTQLYRYDLKYLSEIIALFNRTVQVVNRQDYSQLEINEWVQVHPDLDEWHQRLTQTYSLVAISDGKVVGFSKIDEDGQIDLLYVSSLMIRQQIGTRLLAGLTNYQRRYLQTKIQSVDASITAVPFFEQQGFKVVRQQNNYRRQQNLINYCMVRTIGPEYGSQSFMSSHN